MILVGTMDGMITAGQRLTSGLMKIGVNNGEKLNMHSLIKFLLKNLLLKIPNYKMR